MTQFDFLIPVFEAFNAEGHQLFLVGGCVRDNMLGVPTNDFDLCTSADVFQTESILKSVGANVFEMGQSGHFGTVHSKFQGEEVQVTTFRQDSEVGDTLAADLLNRDFTINAMLLDLLNPASHPLNNQGEVDLMKNGILRCPQSANKIIGDDPVRILRAIRFAFKFELSFDGELMAAMRFHAPKLKEVKVERVHAEFNKILSLENPELIFGLMMELGVLQVLIPELTSQVGFDQKNPHHHLPLWEHTLEVVKHTVLQGGTTRSVMAALLHDVAKPVSNQHRFECRDCGNVTLKNFSPVSGIKTGEDCGHNNNKFIKQHFLGHDEVGAKMAVDIMRRLNFSGEDIKAVEVMIDCHQSAIRKSFSVKDARRFANKFGNLAGEFIPLLKADRIGHAPGMDNPEAFFQLEELLKNPEIFEAKNPPMPVNGKEVMALLGMSQGKELGNIMKALKEKVIDGDIVTKEEAIAFVKTLV